MFKPMLIGSALVSLLSAPLAQAEQSPESPMQSAQPGQVPAWVQTPGRMAPPLPAWVEERRAQLRDP